jgi:tRNA(adenine34) deaminase
MLPRPKPPAARRRISREPVGLRLQTSRPVLESLLEGHNAALSTVVVSVQWRTGPQRHATAPARTGEILHADQAFMAMALDEARQAEEIGEVPIGAVVVCEGAVVARAFNRREIDHDPAGHAEFLAVREASRRLERWRLSDCTVYVTLEPCPMCAGLMHQARISRLVYGATDPKAGAVGTLYDLSNDERLNHRFEVTSGVLAEESSALLQGFFDRLRKRQ